MEGTDVQTGNIDENVNHDRTYYGNGCTPSEYPQGSDGSPRACSSRIATTADNENQKNGTYYKYIAATSGSGGDSTTVKYSVVPDTFCPLGWQLPYGGTGGDYYDKSKSFVFLLSSYGLEEEQGIYSKKAAYVQSYPFSQTKGGFMRIQNGKLYEKQFSGSNISKTVENGYGYFPLNMYGSGDLQLRDAASKNTANAVRCTLIL